MQYRRRNSLRYPGYDYAQPGAVFVTICTYGRQSLFGTVQDGQMAHSPLGEVAVERWQTIPGRFKAVDIDAFVVMPDHIHGIVFCGTTDDEARKATTGDVVRWFKSAVQSDYRQGVRDLDWPVFDTHMWQRAYHDRIIRTAGEFTQYRRYIAGNPGRWWEAHLPTDDDLASNPQIRRGGTPGK